MAAPNIRIDIASVFKDKGFKQASKSSIALERQFKSLGRTFLSVFSTAAIVRFGKESVRAFAEDEKAARRLEQTLKGVNLGFAAPQVESYFTTLEKSTGILKEQLRPALESLIRTTGTVTTAQNLLGTAIDVSTGSGYDLVTVANDLSKAYLGNSRNLSKYNTGLTKTELQAKSFAEIQKVLNDQFSGQRAAYLTTYAGKTEALRVAYSGMQDTIGKGLVDAFSEIQGENGIAGATSAMEDFGRVIADVTRGIGVMVGKVTGLGGADNPFSNLLKILGKSGTPFGLFDVVRKIGEKSRKSEVTPGGRILAGLNDARLKAAEEASIRRQKELEKLRTKSIKAQEKSNKLRALAAKLDKLGTKYDLERIQIAAALQGKISEGDRLRLQELETIAKARQAIAEGDLEESNKLIEALDALGEKFKQFQASMEKAKSTDPFEKLPEQVAKANAAIASLKNIPLGMEGDYIPQIVPKYPYNPRSFATPPSFTTPVTPQSVVPSNAGEILGNAPAVSTGGSTNVTVNVAGSVTSELDLTNQILQNLYQYQKSGRRVQYEVATI